MAGFGNQIKTFGISRENRNRQFPRKASNDIITSSQLFSNEEFESMPQQLTFHKMEASGNDFIVVDNRLKLVKDATAFAKKICVPHTGVGADGLLLLESSRKADFKMRIVNSDGSEAEACGNGFRCIALYAHTMLKLPTQFKFESLAGLIEARIQKNNVKVKMVKPTGYKEGQIEVLQNRLHYFFLNTGVPHVVIFVQGLRKVDVQELGRAIRNHASFKPKGTNVNFVEVTGKKSIHVRTYERGVEQETLACGTGSTAAAIVSALMGYTTAPVSVKTSGGELLTIDFKIAGKDVKSAYLEGEARFVYEGKLMETIF